VDILVQNTNQRPIKNDIYIQERRVRMANARYMMPISRTPVAITRGKSSVIMEGAAITSSLRTLFVKVRRYVDQRKSRMKRANVIIDHIVHTAGWVTRTPIFHKPCESSAVVCNN